MDTSSLVLSALFVDNRNIFLSGPGGVGKSYLITEVIRKQAQEKGKKIAITSTTGVSALVINGSTIHRWSGIKLGKESSQTIVNRLHSKYPDKIKDITETDILVIDEISMMGRDTFQLIDKVLKKIRKNNKPFGGLKTVFSGDFLQLPPVGDEFCFTSDIWDELDMRIFVLKIPYRFPDLDHFQLLQRVRKGKPTKEDLKLLKSRVDAYFKYIKENKNDKIRPTRILSLKKDVEKVNMDELDKINSKLHAYSSVDKFLPLKEDEKVGTKEIVEYTEFLNSVVPKQVLFKVGAQVMLTYNLSPDIGLVNGSRGIIEKCEADGVVVSFKNGISSFIVYNSYSFEDSRNRVVRMQLPLILASAISIHKSQGSTLDYAIMDLGPSIFSAGMAYVALSRVKTLQGLLLTSFVPQKIYADNKAVVFEELIENLANLQEEEFIKDSSEEDEPVEIESSEDSVETEFSDSELAEYLKPVIL